MMHFLVYTLDMFLCFIMNFKKGFNRYANYIHSFFLFTFYIVPTFWDFGETACFSLYTPIKLFGDLQISFSSRA